MTTPFSESGSIPVDPSTPVVTYSPLTLDMPGRPVPLDIKVSMPATGSALPVLLLSHGHGRANFLSSLHGYGPLANFWAAHGFVVIQPTHLDSASLGLRDSGLPDAPLFSRSRARDMRFIVDNLSTIEATVPGLGGRLDRERIAAVGHSLGGHTVSLLLGMVANDPNADANDDLGDARVRAGVVMGAPGIGQQLAPWASEHYPVLKYVDFSAMARPALVIAGDADLNPSFSDRVSYRWDAYTNSPSPKTLLTFFDAGHILGGISGYDAAETTDENPERVATLRALAWAYLRSQLYPGDAAWKTAVAALEAGKAPIAKVDSK